MVNRYTVQTTCISSMLLFATIMGCGVESNHSNTKPSAPSQPISPQISVGDRCEISAKGESVFVYPEYKDMNTVMDVIIAKDDIGLANLKRAGKFFICPAGTRSQLIENGVLAKKVRILGGEHFGEAGWVAAEFVHPTSKSESANSENPRQKAKPISAAPKKLSIRDATANRDLQNTKRLLGKNDHVARKRLETIVDKYPGTEAAEEAAGLLGK